MLCAADLGRPAFAGERLDRCLTGGLTLLSDLDEMCQIG
jgi:hypothetical protein